MAETLPEIALKVASQCPKKPSYYARNKDKMKDYQNRYNELHRGPGKRRKVAKRATAQTSGSSHSISPSDSSSPSHSEQVYISVNPPCTPFYRFGLTRIMPDTKITYMNPWVGKGCSDPLRTESMLFAETQLALELHALEGNLRNRHGSPEWGPIYIEKLKEWIHEEALQSTKTRHLALDKMNPPYLLRRVHGHRRHIACLLQEVDLIEKAMDDLDEPDVSDPATYVRDAVNRGHAIITGAPLNGRLFEMNYGF